MSDRGWDDGRDPFDDLHVLDDLDADGEQIDFAKVHADDAFLDALAAPLRDDRPADDWADTELAVLLTSWRDEVDSEPIRDLVDSRVAADTVFTARVRKQRRHRGFVPFAAAAAVFAVAFTGAGLAAADARPGDTLWGLTKVLYADHARSVQAAEDVKEDLNIAQTALADGDMAQARTKLLEVKESLPAVAVEDGQSELAAQHADLESRLPENPADGVIPPPSANPTTAAPSTPPTGEDTTAATAPTTTESTQPPTTTPSSPPTSTSAPTTSSTSSTEARDENPGSTEPGGDTESAPMIGTGEPTGAAEPTP